MGTPQNEHNPQPITRKALENSAIAIVSNILRSIFIPQ